MSMSMHVQEKKNLFQKIIKAMPHNQAFVFDVFSQLLPVPKEGFLQNKNKDSSYTVSILRDYLAPEYFEEDCGPVFRTKLLGKYIYWWSSIKEIDIEMETIRSFFELLKSENILEFFSINSMTTGDIVVEDPYDNERYELIESGKLYAFNIFASAKKNNALILQEFVDRYFIERKKRELLSVQKQISVTADYILRKRVDFDVDNITLNVGGFFHPKLLEGTSVVDDSQYLDPKVFQKIRLMSSLRELFAGNYITIRESFYSASAIDIVPSTVEISVSPKQVQKLERDFKVKSINEGRPGYLKSIHLITESIVLKDKIFLVLDEQYQSPVRYAVKNNNGDNAAITKLYALVYMVNAPGKEVIYSRKVMDSLNNGIFLKKQIADYMGTNKLKTPTLVCKSEDGRRLVLKNEIPVERIKIEEVPQQYRYLYIDKTK